MSECYGMLHYLEQYKDRAKRTIAAMCIDAPAGKQTLAGTEYTWVLNPQSASSYVDSFVLHLAAEYFPSVGRPWAWSEHRSGTDNYLGDLHNRNPHCSATRRLWRARTSQQLRHTGFGRSKITPQFGGDEWHIRILYCVGWSGGEALAGRGGDDQWLHQSG